MSLYYYFMCSLWNKNIYIVIEIVIAMLVRIPYTFLIILWSVQLITSVIRNKLTYIIYIVLCSRYSVLQKNNFMDYFLNLKNYLILKIYQTYIDLSLIKSTNFALVLQFYISKLDFKVSQVEENWLPLLLCYYCYFIITVGSNGVNLVCI
jgi:hypothetical protein